MGYRLRMLPMTSRDRWRHNGDFTLFSLKCFFSGNSCQNWTILEHNVPLYGASIWSSRIVDPGLMTSLITSSRIIIVATLGLNVSETRPDSGMVSTDSLYKLAYGLSTVHAPDNVTWQDDVITVTTWSLNDSRAVFGGIRWHFNTMLSRTVCLIYMDSLSGSYDVADDVISSQVPVSWRNVHRMAPRQACIRGVLKVHVEVKSLKIRPVLCLTCSTLYDFKRPCVRRIIGAGRAQNVWRRGSRFGQYENS